MKIIPLTFSIFILLGSVVLAIAYTAKVNAPEPAQNAQESVSISVKGSIPTTDTPTPGNKLHGFFLQPAINPENVTSIK